MRVRFLSLTAAALLAGLSLAGSATAATFEPRTAASATNGIVLGPDGDIWVAEQFNDSVARFTPSGDLAGRWTVGTSPTSITTGPGGKVWVAVSGDDKLAVFDALAPTPTFSTISTAAISACGPVGITAGVDQMYFAMPSDGTAGCTATRIGRVPASGTGAPVGFAPIAGQGATADLAFVGGKLFAPDFDSDVIRRLDLNGVQESVTTAPAGSGPKNIAVDGSGTLWVTGYNSGKVLRFPSTQNGGAAVDVPVPGGAPSQPDDVLASSDGNIYVTSSGNGILLRLSPDGATARHFPVPRPGAEPAGLTQGPDGDLYVANGGSATFYRFVSAAPRVAATSAAVTADAAKAGASATVDPRGNDTTVAFDYGTSTDYGRTAQGPRVPSGTAPVGVGATLAGLGAGLVYHVRVRATNTEGTTYGPDTVFITPAAPGPIVLPLPPTITAASLARSSFKTKGKKAGTTLSVTVSQPLTGITALVTQRAKGVKKTKAGKTTCVAPPKKKAKGQRSCTRTITKGTVALGALKAGQNSVPFTGTIRGRKLVPGKYTLTITVGAAIRTLTFTVKR